MDATALPITATQELLLEKGESGCLVDEFSRVNVPAIVDLNVPSGRERKMLISPSFLLRWKLFSERRRCPFDANEGDGAWQDVKKRQIGSVDVKPTDGSGTLQCCVSVDALA